MYVVVNISLQYVRVCVMYGRMPLLPLLISRCPLIIMQILAAGAPPQLVNVVASSMGRSFVLDGDGYVGGACAVGVPAGQAGRLCTLPMSFTPSTVFQTTAHRYCEQS